MKIAFDSHQGHQLAAIDAVIHLFDGQAPKSSTQQDWNEDGLPIIRNQFRLKSQRLYNNLRRVQRLYELPQTKRLTSLNFSIEMETGTGKTYVYLRTIHELYKRYGFCKFIIVVPSVAIREGVQKNLQLTREHFKNLYNNTEIQSWTYDSRDTSKLRSVAQSTNLQLILINIDAFNKPGNNIIHRESDLLGGAAPIDYIRRTQPILILDEPQNMESSGSKAALHQLNPLFTLRYSATHRKLYNLIYRLDPVTAYKQKLVKSIEVQSVQEARQLLNPFIKIKSIAMNQRGVAARLEIDIQGNQGISRQNVTVQNSDVNLFSISGKHPAYDGYLIQEIDNINKYVRFHNGLTLSEGETHGEQSDHLMKYQIQQTIIEHLDKELLIQRTLPEGQRLKVLSLFFIDKVKNYDSQTGKFRQWFKESYQALKDSPVYSCLNLPQCSEVHNGYFAQSKGRAKDTNGKGRLDQEAYALIMRDKERLLNLHEPLRFIFSHSALREGWDNPNVFQICTLNESKSELKKRQEIGRGLRLPVNQQGKRCFNPNINRVTIIANQSYFDFAQRLQKEMGVKEVENQQAPLIHNANRRVTLELKPQWKELNGFRQLWRLLEKCTKYRLGFSSKVLIGRAAKSLKQMPAILAPSIESNKVLLDFVDTKIQTQLIENQDTYEFRQVANMPDLLKELEQSLQLTRTSLVEILLQSGRLDDAAADPQQFLEYATTRIRTVLMQLMVGGLNYSIIPGKKQELKHFEQQVLISYEAQSVLVNKSIYFAIPCDNKKEKAWIQRLENRSDVLLYLKLPTWLAVDTPMGKYQPDWAIVLKGDTPSKMRFLIRETSGSTDPTQLSSEQWARIKCAQNHYETLGFDFATMSHDEDV